jgi:methionyl aminopeptidase
MSSRMTTTRHLTINNNMIKLKSPDEIQVLKQGGAILASILRELETFIKENYKNGSLTTAMVNQKSDELLKKNHVLASFRTANPPFPTGLCVSVNDEVVHGVPGSKILVERDLVGLDLGVIYKGLYTDAAISFILGNGQSEDKKMIEVTREALYRGIEKAVIGNAVGDIGHAIEKYIVDNGFGLVRDYCGHGVGYSVHEEPPVPNYGCIGSGEVLKEGTVIAIEPMVVTDSGEVYVDNNNWTVKTEDGGRSSHWEHTVAVTKDGPVILTE